MFNKLAASIVALGITIGCAATAAPVSDENAVVPAGVGIVAGTCASTGPGTINGCNGIYNNGVPVAGGLTVPTAPLIGGTGTALAPINLGTNLSITGGTLNATGGASPGGTTGQIQTNNGSGGLGALPTNTTGASVVLQTTSSGTVAPTVLPLATTSALGAIKPDGTTITVNGSGVASAVGGAATSVTVGTTSVGAGTPGAFLSVSGSTLGNVSPTGTGPVVLGTSPTIATPTMTGTTTTAGIADSGGINTTFASGYSITGTPVLNLLSNQTSPILSPETGNAPSPSAAYIPSPQVLGYNATYVANTYESMITSNLTINGTASNHYGMRETTMNLLGTGTYSSELNNEKYYVVVPSGMTLGVGSSSENVEASVSNNGTLTGVWSGFKFSPINQTGATLGEAIGFSVTPINQNSTTNSFVTSIGLSCYPQTGSGSAIPHLQCVFNQDPKSEITNSGHYGARQGSAAPVLTACGTSPTISTQAGDAMGTITEGSSATGCTMTFSQTYSTAGGGPACVISSPNGSQFTGYSTTATTLVITNLSATGSQFNYWCTDEF